MLQGLVYFSRVQVTTGVDADAGIVPFFNADGKNVKLTNSN
jgi:hypothetical protein